MTNTPPTATQADTIQALLERSKRDAVPIRKSFLQQGSGKVRDAGPIASLCSRHDERALDLYLLIHAAASAKPFDVVHPAGVWARAIGLSNSPSAKSSISKALTRLTKLHLIKRGARAGNRSRLLLLDESGHGDPYSHPARYREPYIKLPHTYWSDGWYLKLSLPGKVVLLIALSLDDKFTLPIQRAKDWYGISPDTMQRGLAELAEFDLLEIDVRFRPEPFAPDGYTQERRFTLRSPFGPRRTPMATVTQLRAG